LSEPDRVLPTLTERRASRLRAWADKHFEDTGATVFERCDRSIAVYVPQATPVEEMAPPWLSVGAVQMLYIFRDREDRTTFELGEEPHAKG
jgi:hypothetical protein